MDRDTVNGLRALMDARDYVGLAAVVHARESAAHAFYEAMLWDAREPYIERMNEYEFGTCIAAVCEGGAENQMRNLVSLEIFMAARPERESELPHMLTLIHDEGFVDGRTVAMWGTHPEIGTMHGVPLSAALRVRAAACDNYESEYDSDDC